ncbi:mucin-3A [Triplophysa rosa]|uniref:mucin-3A n=1 Tax=Triplophysa rosa TaxID=992332 RepID=UPI0025462B4B|nr:mucin-3A [Triplophysa rosa]
MNTDMLLLVLSVFTLMLQAHSQRLSDQSTLTASPASVYKESNTVQLKTDGPTDAEETPRETPSSPSLFTTVITYNEKPNITVFHHSSLGEFRITCEIPGSENTGCCLFLGDSDQPLLKTDSHKRSGKILCSFTIQESDLFIKLRSVKSKSVSCNYSPKTDPSRSSPHSDKYNLTVQTPRVTTHQLPNTEPKTEESTIYSTSTFSTITSTTEPQTSIPSFGNTTGGADETTPSLFSIPVSWSTTPVFQTSTPVKTEGSGRKSWFIMLLASTGGGILLTGLTGICLCCFNSAKHKPKKMSPMETSMAFAQRPPDDTEESEELSEEHEDKVYHVYCTISDVSTERHELYSLAQIPKQPLQN